MRRGYKLTLSYSHSMWDAPSESGLHSYPDGHRFFGAKAALVSGLLHMLLPPRLSTGDLHRVQCYIHRGLASLGHPRQGSFALQALQACTKRRAGASTHEVPGQTVCRHYSKARGQRPVSSTTWILSHIFPCVLHNKFSFWDCRGLPCAAEMYSMEEILSPFPGLCKDVHDQI